MKNSPESVSQEFGILAGEDISINQQNTRNLTLIIKSLE